MAAQLRGDTKGPIHYFYSRFLSTKLMIQQTKKFLSGPWTASKIWALVSTPLAVAGLANATQSFLDLGSLVAYLLIFYNEITERIVTLLSIILHIEINKYLIHYWMIGAPFITPMTWMYVRLLFDKNNEHYRKSTDSDNLGLLQKMLAVFVFFLLCCLLLWPLFFCAMFWVQSMANANMPGNEERKAISLRETRLVIDRANLVLASFLILSAISFSIERWIDPDFLKLKPDHLGLDQKAEQVSNHGQHVRRS